MRFLTWAWDYEVASGGCVALHRLAHNLAALGHDSILTCNRTAPGWLGRTGGCRASAGMIAIYPEIVDGNPLGAQRVVRWLLNTPGFFGVGSQEYGGNDLVMLWQWKYGAALDPKYVYGGLLTAYRDLSHFRDRPDIRQREFGNTKRWSHSYIVRKADRMPGVITDGHHEADAIPLDGYGTDERLIEVLNLSQRFTCYDPNTMVSTLAHLCSVPEIVLPNGGDVLSREQVVARQELSVQQTQEFAETCERHWK